MSKGYKQKNHSFKARSLICFNIQANDVLELTFPNVCIFLFHFKWQVEL